MNSMRSEGNFLLGNEDFRQGIDLCLPHFAKAFKMEIFDGHRINEFPSENLKKFLRQGIKCVVDIEMPGRMKLKLDA